MLRSSILSLALASLLSACGGGGSTGISGPTTAGELPAIPDTATPAEAFGLYETAFFGISDGLDDRFNTAFFGDTVIEGMPGSGTRTYNGVIAITLNTPDGATVLFGGASVDADFGGGTLSGDAGDFAGRDRDGIFDDYAGTLDLNSGTIGGIVPNDFDLAYIGTLTGNGEVIDLDGTLIGKFKADPILGLRGSDTGDIATVDSVATTGTIDLAVGDPDG